jgi:MFS superfamily sulfate permease-like transporter
MVGVALVAGGLFRLGWIADLLSVPVTTGFLAGISVHILISQLPSVLGLPHQDGPMTRRVLFLAAHIGDANLFPLSIGLGVLAIIGISERLSARCSLASITRQGPPLGLFFRPIPRRPIATPRCA